MLLASDSTAGVSPILHLCPSSLLPLQENVMEAARLTLRQAMKRLDRAYKQSKSNHMIYLFVFALAMFFAVFFWSKVYRFFKWIL